MAERTAIEWCDSTFNPWIGCTRVSPACDDCYAARSTPARAFDVAWGAGQPRRRTSASTWAMPHRWNAKRFMQCGQCGWRGERTAAIIGCGRCGSIDLDDTRRRVFCASLADVFDNEVPVQWRRDLFDLIDATPNLDWLLLTKRIGNARSLYAECYLDSARPWPSNVWLGATVVNQEEADRDIPKLLATPARVRFLSMEPLLGPVDLTQGGHGWLNVDELADGTRTRLHWVIVGGESGPHARPMHPEWVRSLRDQCAAAGVPFLFKQWGEWLPGSQARDVDNQMALVGACTHGYRWDDGTHSWRIGKKAAGRLLDGCTHDQFPEVHHAR